MAKKSVIVRGNDKKRCSQGYWEARLKRMGLTMDAGRANWIDYGHAVTALDFDGRIAYAPPTGEITELEWPMSL